MSAHDPAAQVTEPEETGFLVSHLNSLPSVGIHAKQKEGTEAEGSTVGGGVGSGGTGLRIFFGILIG
jgi:hypothetical protein